MAYVAESGHWYDAGGNPRYTIIGKNGKERATTLRDAREHGFFPSVTTIIKCAAAPALTNWLIDQALMAALTLPRLPDESLDAFMARAKADGKEQGRKAAEAGSELHGSLEKWFTGSPVQEKHVRHCKAVDEALKAIGIDGHSGFAEKSFSCKLGYGGKLDLNGQGWIVDFKSKPMIEEGKDYGYDEHAMQLAAYAQGLNDPCARLINVFVGLEDAKVSIKEWEPSERYFAQFFALLNYWQAKNQYIPK